MSYSSSPSTYHNQAQRLQMREDGIEFLFLAAGKTSEIRDGALPVNQHQRHPLTAVQRKLFELIAQRGPAGNDHQQFWSEWRQRVGGHRRRLWVAIAIGGIGS